MDVDVNRVTSLGRALAPVSLLAMMATALGAAPPPSVIVLILDGTRADTFYQLLDAGRLPNFQEHVADRGLRVENAVTVFPSTTGPSYAPFVTGRVPGTSGITGLRWYDRTTGRSHIYAGRQFGQINDALDPGAPTVYELLPKDASAAVFGMVDRGCARSQTPFLSIAAPKLRGKYVDMDRGLYQAFRKLALEADPFPRFAFLSLHAPDSVGHAHGIADPEYVASLEAIDGLVGDLAATLKARGRYHSTTLIVSADHGQSDVTEHQSLAEHLSGYGLRVRDSVAREPFFANLSRDSRKRKYDVHVEVNGNAAVFFYLNAPEAPAAERTPASLARAFPARGGGTVDIEAALLESPAVELVLGREGPGRYRVAGRAGAATLEGDRRGFTYQVVAGRDPLGLAGRPEAASLFDGRPHDADEWFRASAASEYPDAPFQIAQLLEAARAPDLVVSAAPGWEPWQEGQTGLHGGLRREHMRVPLLVGGPGIPPRRIARARTVDVFPTVCEILGIPVPAGQDGVALPVGPSRQAARQGAFQALHGE